MSEERYDEPSPNGGAYSIAVFSKADGTLCSREQASNVEITEYSAKDEVIMRTYGTLTPKRGTLVSKGKR